MKQRTQTIFEIDVIPPPTMKEFFNIFSDYYVCVFDVTRAEYSHLAKPVDAYDNTISTR